MLKPRAAFGGLVVAAVVHGGGGGGGGVSNFVGKSLPCRRCEDHKIISSYA